MKVFLSVFFSLIASAAVLLVASVAVTKYARAQQAVAPGGGMAPVAQHLTDNDISYTYVSDVRGVFVTIFTKDRNWKAAPTCELLTEIGPVTKVTIWYEIEEPTTETITIKEAGNITIHDGSVDSAVCTK